MLGNDTTIGLGLTVSSGNQLILSRCSIGFASHLCGAMLHLRPSLVLFASAFGCRQVYAG